MFAHLNVAPIAAGFMRAACLAFALSAMAVSAHAQQSAPEPSANALKMAREIIDLKNATVVFEPMVPSVIDRVKAMLAQTNPALIKDLDDVANNLRKAFAPRTADLLADISWVYASRFSEAELKEILTFYRTPTGKKVITQEPQVFDDAMAGLPGWQDKFSEEVIERFRVEMKKRGHDL
jgi:hypothetical protein